MDKTAEVSTTTNIVIKVNGKVIGAVQSIDIKRDIKKGVITGHCKRVRFDQMRIEEAFTGKSDPPKQFDITLLEKLDDITIETTLINSCITATNYSYSADSMVIVDGMDFETENISFTKHFTQPIFQEDGTYFFPPKK